MMFLFYFYKTPLVYAIRRRDVRAVRLLLDFDADINNYQGIPPLYIAAKAGFYEGVRMLRQKGAILDQNGDNALLASVESGSRECFTAMIEGQEHIILKKIRSHSLSYYAIELKSNLLPIIASITDKQCTLQKGIMDADETEFPPSDIKKNDLKKFKTALDLQDQYLPYNEIKAETKRVKSIFSQISENSQDDEVFVDLDDPQIQHNDNYNRNDFEVNNNTNNFNNFNENSLNSDDVYKSNNKIKKHSQKADSSAFLPQIPLNSDSTKGSYESANSGSNLQNDQNNQTKKLTKIEEISIKNKNKFKLSQNQLNNQQSLQDVFSSSDDLVNKDDDETEEEEEYEKPESKKDRNNNNNFTEEEEEYEKPESKKDRNNNNNFTEEEDIEYINEEEEDEFENEIEEEEEEIENELRNNQGENYEYETEYEYEVVTTDVVTTQNK